VLKQFRNRPVANDARQLAAWPHEYFTIQLGAFANPQAATKELQSFRSKKLEAVQENLPRRGNAMWVVMVGRYQTYAEAAGALPQIRKAAAGAFIIPQD
jgi:septal ring-binding cell division protein DamX